ncbi:hypothetical protein [Lysobacter changpingensis]|uniref:hypothetical protein n=1 Tax=Lysobacter changpingensis TaxID=2792784 RepID=UPI001A8BF4B8|nr:hypothetical protein [Lysobacter changpingensis]
MADGAAGVAVAVAICMNRKETTVDGASVKLWQGWLNDLNSPPFQALTLRHKPLLDNLQPHKNGQGEREWNDTQKLHDALNKLIGSQDFGEKLLFASVKDAAAQTLLAVNSAATQLKPLLAAGIENLTTRLTVSGLLLHERVHATQLKVTMTVADYYALQCRTLREQQAKLARQAGRKTGQQVVSPQARITWTTRPMPHIADVLE